MPFVKQKLSHHANIGYIDTLKAALISKWLKGAQELGKSHYWLLETIDYGIPPGYYKTIACNTSLTNGYLESPLSSKRRGTKFDG